MFRYFPAVGWDQWSGDRKLQQFLQHGIIQYLQFEEAKEQSVHHTSGDRRQGPSVHATWQYRNVLAIHIARNSAVYRHFVQYLALQAAKVVMLVRNAKTGDLLVTPDDEDCWLARERVGYGRAKGDDDWIVRRKVGENMFEMMSGKARKWRFGFNDYYDVVLWDVLPGQTFNSQYAVVCDQMTKARRRAAGVDLYDNMKDILQTIRTEPDTGRTRAVRDGENTLYDHIWNGSRFMFFDRESASAANGDIAEAAPAVNFFYSDLDAVEDLVLFPEELQGAASTEVTDRTDPLTTALERCGPNWKRFINGLDSDDDSDDFEDPFDENG